MKFIGITGGVGAGKSAVLDYLKNNYACRVMLADEIAHDLMEPGTDCYHRLMPLFADLDVYADAEVDETKKAAEVKQKNGAEDGLNEGNPVNEPPFDRKKLAAVLFSDDSLLEQMNAIVHPAVHEYVTNAVDSERKKGSLSLLVLEAALLIEENYGAICDELWYIYASEDVRRARLKASRGYSDEKTSSIIAAQLSEDEYRKHCTVIIDNSGDFKDTEIQIRNALSERGILQKQEKTCN